MTCTDTATAGDPEAGDAATPAKAVLFCPRCEYHAPYNGGWNVHTSPGRRSVYCPACGTRVA